MEENVWKDSTVHAMLNSEYIVIGSVRNLEDASDLKEKYNRNIWSVFWGATGRAGWQKQK